MCKVWCSLRTLADNTDSARATAHLHLAWLHKGAHNGGGFLKRALQLLVGFLLDGLGILQLFDQLHLDALHVHHFVLLIHAARVFNLSAVELVPLRHVHPPLAVLVDLELRKALLL